jgi:RND family efflux transporter MFP subunit
MKKKYVVFGALAGVLVFYLVYRTLFIHQKVTVTEVQRGNLVTVVYATGNVGADSTATLRSEAGGVVTYVGAHEGMHVSRGAVLLKTDDSDDLLRVEQSKADLDAARIDFQNKNQNLERARALFESRSVTQKSLDDAQRDVDLAKVSLQQRKIALDIAKERLSKTQVTAPFSGVIISASAKLGDYLLPNGSCFQMIAPTSILVEAEVDEQDFSRVRSGQKCVVAFDAFGDERFDGYIYRIVPKTDEETKTSKVFVKLEDPPENLNVGMTATVNIISSELRDVDLLPRTAIVQLPNSNVVYEVIGGKVKIVEVKLGATDGRLSQILGGNLQPGTDVVSQPGPNLKDGMRVEVTK